MAPQTSAHTEQSFYIPLDRSTSQIRLLHLQPRVSSTSNEIVCSLHLASLDDQTCPYEALSYEWGDIDSISLYSIQLDGRKRAVRENLWWALWNLRDEKMLGIFWIDALCIDQENVEERSHQVCQMGRLYEQASRVIAWIGCERSPVLQKKGDLRISTALEVEAAFNFANRLYGDSEENRFFRCSTAWHRLDKTKASRPDYRSLLEDNDDCVTKTYRGWKLLLDVYKRSYWTRLWIVQEFVLAKNVVIQCGKFRLEWPVLEHLCVEFEEDDPVNEVQRAHRVPNAYNALRNPDSTPAQRIFQQRRRRSRLTTRPESLSKIFSVHYHAACSDIRDKVFGLLGMSSSCCQEAVDIDYSVPNSELCRKFISHHMQHQQCYGVGEKQPRSSEFCRIIKMASLLFHGNNNVGNIGKQQFPAVFLRGNFRGIISGWKALDEGVNSAQGESQHSEENQISTEPASNIIWRNNDNLLWPIDSSGRSLCPWSNDPYSHSAEVVQTQFETILLYGDVRNRDLSYEIDQFNELILRKQGEGLLVVGKITTHPRDESHDSYHIKLPYADRLSLDYSALCTLCQNVEFGEFMMNNKDEEDNDNSIEEISRGSTVRVIPPAAIISW